MDPTSSFWTAWCGSRRGRRRRGGATLCSRLILSVEAAAAAAAVVVVGIEEGRRRGREKVVDTFPRNSASSRGFKKWGEVSMVPKGNRM